jgi:UDP-N-acetylglucosamine/UDP-N-acetylgalactosamine diphosphorylase
MFSKLVNVLKEHHQEHLLKFQDELSESQKTELKAQLEDIDWEQLDELLENYVVHKPQTEIPQNLTPPPFFPAEPVDAAQRELYKKATKLGEQLIGEGKVSALTVAGGQGTRLGFDGPKGTYPITPVKNKTLFQYFAESLYKAGEKFGSPITWYIMTSVLNDQQTKDFFAQNNYFGLNANQVVFFAQGTMPCFSTEGKILLADKGSLALAPNGHGGTLLALKTSGALDRMKAENVEYISYFQVDNPLISVVNPLFIGLHHLENSEMSAIMLSKTGPYEKLGNFCMSGDKLQIIEYSDLPDDLAEARNPDGSLRFIAGSPAIHVISRDFVEHLTSGGRLNLPWHRADKKVPYINENGILENPETPNAVKLESFIFDALPLAKETMILEALREEEFAPTKNKTGVDSVESCRAMLVARDAKRLEKAGVKIPRKSDQTPDCLVELSPKSFFDESDVIEYSKTNGFSTPKSGEEVYYQ